MHVALTGPRKKNEGPKSHVWRNLILSNQKSLYTQFALPAYAQAALPARVLLVFVPSWLATHKSQI